MVRGPHRPLGVAASHSSRFYGWPNHPQRPWRWLTTPGGQLWEWSTTPLATPEQFFYLFYLYFLFDGNIVIS